MDLLKGFKPNLIPNNPKDGSFTAEKRNAVINKNGGIEKYIVIPKKDGCRMQLGISDKILGRSLKEPQSILVRERFAKLNQLCIDLKIAVDGEFYMHGLKLNEIFRFFSNEDVTREKVRVKLIKEMNKNFPKFQKDYNGKDIAFLTTFHKDLKFWLFDGVVLDRPDLVGFAERMTEIERRLAKFKDNPEYFLIMPNSFILDSVDDIDWAFNEALNEGWEGLVLTHMEHVYKYGRNTLKQGTILKLKNDNVEYDGVILDIVEATEVKEGVEKTVNELGRSRTSKKKEDRRPSGMAKGFVVQFGEIGTFTVGLKGFDNEQKRELLENKENYIGRHFKYNAMPPNKDFPISAYFKSWRDEK